jgi:hypothetical protein
LGIASSLQGMPGGVSGLERDAAVLQCALDACGCSSVSLRIVCCPQDGRSQSRITGTRRTNTCVDDCATTAGTPSCVSNHSHSSNLCRAPQLSSKHPSTNLLPELCPTHLHLIQCPRGAGGIVPAGKLQHWGVRRHDDGGGVEGQGAHSCLATLPPPPVLACTH